MQPRTAAVGVLLVAEALLSFVSLHLGVALFALTVIFLLTAYTFRAPPGPGR
ncbi:MAG TPA: hypothetical protein VFP61_02040 [Acidimicrobiales bacterium]|nr:hypothetical protein [Acidimicrobiales bacterium]